MGFGITSLWEAPEPPARLPRFRACGLPRRCSDEAPPPPLALTVAERRGWQRLKYSFNGHAETQQLVVTAGRPIDLEPHRQTVARKPRGNAQRRRAKCRTGKRIP